ncbi:GNAT family N-acetyltransferase [Streptomyces xanthophaeus]|uniref:hypothetical protein n=1 Tax=Streptomyces xanthophaeus TaxID=67385 RepID=UPI00371DDFFE
MIEVRRAAPSDGDALGEIHAAAWEAVYAPFFAPEFAGPAVRSRRTRWHARLAEGEGTILLAERDGRPLAIPDLAWVSPASAGEGNASLARRREAP